MPVEPRVSSRALVREDPRNFLTRVVDRALEHKTLTVVDLHLIDREIEAVALQYLARRKWDIRDLGAVRNAAQISCLFIDDGLAFLSGGDLDAAAGVIQRRSLADCYRASQSEMEMIRREFNALRDKATVWIGPPRARFTIRSFPPMFFQAKEGWSLPFSDDDLFAASQRGEPVARVREKHRTQLDLICRQLVLLRALPLDEPTRHWRKILNADVYAVADRQTLDAYQMAWSGALIRALIRGDVGIVVRLSELRAFLRRYDLDKANRRNAAIAEATDRLVTALAPSTSFDPRPFVEQALHDAVMAIGVQLLPQDGEESSPGTVPFDSWSSLMFLEVTEEERAQLQQPDDLRLLGRGTLIDRFRFSQRRDERVRLLEALDLATAPVETIVELVMEGPALIDEIVNRVNWVTLDHDGLRQLLDLECSSLVAQAIAAAIITRRPRLRGLPADIIRSCLSPFPDDLTFRKRVFERWRPTPAALLRAFRRADDEDERCEWLAFASVSPRHLAHIIVDARTFPTETAAIRRCFAQIDSGAGPILGADAVVALFRHLESKAPGRSRRYGIRHPFHSYRRGRVRFLDNDLNWLWEHLHADYKIAVHRAFREDGFKVRRNVPL